MQPIETERCRPDFPNFRTTQLGIARSGGPWTRAGAAVSFRDPLSRPGGRWPILPGARPRSDRGRKRPTRRSGPFHRLAHPRRGTRRRDSPALEPTTISSTPEPIASAAAAGPSTGAKACASWFRQLGRALKICRLYTTDNPVAAQARGAAIDALLRHLAEHGGWVLRFSPSEIAVGEEIVVSAAEVKTTEQRVGQSIEEQLPFFFYRDGIRRIALGPAVPRPEAEALFDSLAHAMGAVRHEDLVTLLWQANLTYIQIDAVPLEQAIYLSSGRVVGRGEAAGSTHNPAWSVAGSEIRSDIGQLGGAQGLHRDTFDDWEVPEGGVDVAEEVARTAAEMAAARDRLRAEWEAESAIPWTEQAPRVLREILRQTPAEETRQALAHAAMSWLVAAFERGLFGEARVALDLLRDFDPELVRSGPELTTALSQLDRDDFTESLDEAASDELGRYAGLAVGIGRPAIDLTLAVLKRSPRTRTRAAMTTALVFLCAEDPEILSPYLADPRWYVVRNIVFILGQIGGPQVVDLLRLAAQHPEPRVRRQVVQSLGNVAATERLPLLLSWIDTPDPQILSTTLQMLVRQKNPEVATAILARIAAPGFESRSGDSQRALLNALAEVADDSVVPALTAMLQRTGWLARRTAARVGAARTLLRMATPAALAAVEAGLRSRNRLVREACIEAGGRLTS